MHPIRHARALVRERLTELVRSEVRAEMRTTVTVAAQVVEARQADASRLASRYDHTRNPSDEYYRGLADRLRGAGVDVQTRRVDVTRFSDWVEAHASLQDIYKDPAVRVEKLLEHFLSEESTHLTAGMTYIDVAAAGNRWVPCLRDAGLNALSLDLSYPQGVHGWRIGADAQEIPLPSGLVDAMSAQCAFECFQCDADIGFVREAARLLPPPGGGWRSFPYTWRMFITSQLAPTPSSIRIASTRARLSCGATMSTTNRSRGTTRRRFWSTGSATNSVCSRRRESCT